VRVAGNLIDNAMKFSPSGGQVVISACVNECGMAQVQISDNGPGIPEEYREKVFERFTQVPGQRSRRRGSGLGLTFCRMAIEAHGGRIWVENQQAPLTGSIFIFTLPLK
jgi:signal transduction histidine kinase